MNTRQYSQLTGLSLEYIISHIHTGFYQVARK